MIWPESIQSPPQRHMIRCVCVCVCVAGERGWTHWGTASASAEGGVVWVTPLVHSTHSKNKRHTPWAHWVPLSF